ncbi:transposase [Streptomyces umbrinus]|nr:transposase [Streptomyces umbrinus]
MLMRDRLDVVFADDDFTHLYPADGRPGFSPGQLALVSVLQFAENLSDRAAADAVRTRIDRKYGLGLELDDPGFDYSLLSEFRARLTEGDRADQLLQAGGKAAVRERAEEFGRDGQKLLTAAWASDAPPRLRMLRQVEILRRVWIHQYSWDREGQLRWREGTALPPASLRFDSPYDTDAHYCVKRDVAWSGYRVHFTESCDQDLPHLVTHVATTIAPVQDGQLTEKIHDDLATRRLAPAEHIVDTAYLTPAHVERAQRVHGITLLGPILADNSRQAKAGSGFAKAAFTIDWDNKQAICPRGATSASWTKLNISGHTYLQARFAESD